MLLLQIRDYILTRQEVTLAELAIHFQMPESAIEKMADLWLQKAPIEKLQPQCQDLDATSGCGGCSSTCSMKNIAPQISKSLVLYRSLSTSKYNEKSPSS